MLTEILQFYLQLQFSVLSNMSTAFKRQILFGLLVLCTYHVSEAQIRFFQKLQTNTLRQRALPIPSTSQNLNINRQVPSHSSAVLSKSMETINLHSKSSSLSSSQSDVFRSLSASSLNTAKSPAIMADASKLHKQAASLLNIKNVNTPYREKTVLQRLRPNPERVSQIGKYLKNSAIAAAGAGGIISMVNILSRDSDEKEINNKENLVTADPINSVDSVESSTHSEITNPIGVDK